MIQVRRGPHICAHCITDAWLGVAALYEPVRYDAAPLTAVEGGGIGAAAASQEMLSALAHLLADERWKFRHAAASAARTVHSLGAAAATPEILLALTRLVADQNREVRFAAVEAIGRLGSGAAPYLVPALSKLRLAASDDDDFQRSAAEIIVRWRDLRGFERGSGWTVRLVDELGQVRTAH